MLMVRVTSPGSMIEGTMLAVFQGKKKVRQKRCHFCKSKGTPCKYCFGTGMLNAPLRKRRKKDV